MSKCIFCQIAAHEIPSKVIFEDDAVFSFHDINPQSPVHAVVIPKLHIDNIAASTGDHEALLGKLLRSAANIAVELGVAETGYRVVINNGVDGGRSVDHLHLHVLGGRKLSWPPG